MAEGFILVTIDFTAEPGTQTEATVERGASATGPWTVLDTVELLGEQAYFYDVTAPIGVATWYRITADDGTEEILGPLTDPDTGSVWLKDPLRPWASIEFDFCENQSGHHECSTPDPVFVWGGFGEETWRVDAGLFDVLNAEHMADVYARRKHADGVITFFTRSLVAKEEVYQLFTAGGPLFLQAPAVYGWDDAYIQPLDVSHEIMFQDQRRPERRWVVPFVIVDPVTGPVQGAECATWCAVDNAFGTFADQTAQMGTWGDVLSGELVCPSEPPVPDGFGAGGFGSGPFGDPI